MAPTSNIAVERRPGPAPADWIRLSPGGPGLERIEARFAGFAYDPHRHDTYAIGVTLAGVQCFDYRGVRADSLPGDVVVLHPDERHDGRAGTPTGFGYRLLYVEPRLIRDALGGRAASLPFVRAPVSRDARLATALRLALDEWERPWEALERDQIVLSLAEALLALDRSAARGSRATPCAVAVERARAFLDANCARGATSETLEAVAGLDRYTLARQFRARLGTSPYRYLMLRRLDDARRRILRGDTLAEAAAASGFADQSHMTRQFKRAYGVSPGRWRAHAHLGITAPPR
jgi:AraC-like DNA-binding protein